MRNERIHHGFSGTQIGWSAKQFDAVQDWMWNISSMDSTELHVIHHGDCDGSDANIHELAFDFGWHIVVHPPSDPSKRAFVHKTKFWDPARCTLLPEKEYLERNAAIVAEAVDLLATPREKQMQIRSGTWATVRYALKKPIPVTLIFRDGSTGREV